jgi:hypothetical protein
VLRLIAVPLPPSKDSFAVPLNSKEIDWEEIEWGKEPGKEAGRLIGDRW